MYSIISISTYTTSYCQSIVTFNAFSLKKKSIIVNIQKQVLSIIVKVYIGRPVILMACYIEFNFHMVFAVNLSLLFPIVVSMWNMVKNFYNNSIRKKKKLLQKFVIAISCERQIDNNDERIVLNNR